MNLTEQQIKICKQIVMTFETGKPLGDYGRVAVLADGPDTGRGRRRQISYGIVQTNEHSFLKDLLCYYMNNNTNLNEEFTISMLADIDEVDPSVDPPITFLAQDMDFKNALHQAGSDPIMQQCQDNLVSEKWFVPALSWASRNLFELPLSMAIIYDSFINSGGVSDTLRSQFTELPPSKGGDEQTWITQYVQARREWLELHYPHNVVRMCNFQKLIVMNNWNLDPPIKIYTYENNGFLSGRAVVIPA